MEKRAEDEKDVYDMTLNYIARGSYPQDATKQDKCAIRKRAKQYRVQDAREKNACKKYFWPVLLKDVRSWVQYCDQCQKTKRKFDHPAEELHPVPVPNSSWKQIRIDLCQKPQIVTSTFPSGQKHRHLNKRSINVAEFLNDLILRHGCPGAML
ncbi:hypothetical protein EMCRGX_G011403 [Ephydatia muelleri]